MMARFEFTRKQRLEIWQRADGCCEGKDCGAKLKTGEGEYDHRIAQGYGGENTVENGQLLCRVCHKAKTGVDKGITEKVKRIRDRHNGVMPKAKKMQSRGFAKREKPRAKPASNKIVPRPERFRR